jgi:DNA-directed RNA polymerase subunit N (RpoN/RPB10)
MSGGYAAIRQDPRPSPSLVSVKESLSAHLYTSFMRNINQQQFCFSGDGAIADVLFCIGSTRYCADRVILSVRSEFFHGLFEDDSTGCDGLRVEVVPKGGGGQHSLHKISMPEWVSEESFLPVLEYIYTGVLPHYPDPLILSRVLKLLSLPSIKYIKSIASPHDALVKDISKIWQDSTNHYTRFANVRILLEDEEYVKFILL